MIGTYLYCDRYSHCNGFIVSRDMLADTEMYARSKGWHIWRGETMGGKESEVILCGRCVQSHRRNLAPAPSPMEGDLQLDI